MEKLKLFLIVEIILLLFMLLELYRKKYKKNCSIIGGSLLVFLISIREGTPDLDIYKKLYYFPDTYEVEKGYIFLQDIFKSFYIDFKFFIIFLALLTIILLYRGFNLLTGLPNSTMFIYMAYSFLEKPYIQVRNALSIAIFINVLFFIINKKRLKSFLGIFLAIYFHITAYFYFVIEIFSLFRISKKKIEIIFKVTIILSIILYFINFIPLLIKLSYLNLGRISERIRVYFLLPESKEYTSNLRFGIRILFSPLIYIFYYLKIQYLEKIFYNNFFKERYIFILFSFSVLFRALSYKIVIFSRVVGNFDFSETLALTLLLKIKNKYLKITYVFLIVIYVFLSNYITGKKLNLW